MKAGRRGKTGPASRASDADHRSNAAALRWQSLLSSELRCPVRVIYSKARRMPLRVRRVGGGARTPVSGLEVRMHAMFADAPLEVLRAVTSWIRSGRRAPRACALLDRWIAATLAELPAAPPRRDPSLDPRGRHHDLARIALDLCAHEFRAEFEGGAGLPKITWGRRGRSQTRHSLRLGSYDADSGIVRIHPALDQPAVPSSFVRYVLFHELLHAVLPPRQGKDVRWIRHSTEFRRREKNYADFKRAIAWEKANMNELIRSARRGTPLRVAHAERGTRIAARTASATNGTSAAKKMRFLQKLLFPA